MPYPEEMNRRLTGTIASYHFSPTSLAREHLLRENVDADDIVVTGNTVIDAILGDGGARDLPHPPRWEELDPRASGRSSSPRTAAKIIAYMREMARRCARSRRCPSRPQIYWPVHPSPHVRAGRARRPRRRRRASSRSIRSITPQMVARCRASTFVLTDSGGLQEEAPCLGKPVLVMREETERPEGLEAGTLELVGHEREQIVAGRAAAAGRRAHYARMARAMNPYGDGRAAGASSRGCSPACAAGRIPSPSTLRLPATGVDGWA